MSGEYRLRGEYKGCLVPLKAVRDKTNPKRIARWEPDPEYVTFVEAKIAAGQMAFDPLAGGSFVRSSSALSHIAVAWRCLAIASEDEFRLVSVTEGEYNYSNWDADLDLYNEYMGETLRMVPVLDMRNQREICFWVQDPDDVRRIEAAHANENRVDGTSGASVAASSVVVIDGSNVVFADNSNLVFGIKTCLKALSANKIRCFVFFDANIFHKLEELKNGPAQVAMLREIIDNSNGSIVVVPAGARADDFILKKADTDGCHVLSNDRFKQHVERYPWIEQNHVHRFAFVDGRLMIPDLDIDVANI